MALEKCVTAKDLLKKFYHLQEERVQSYALFEEGFQGYLKAKPHYNFPLFRQLVFEITETFQKISQDIVLLKTDLETSHQQNSVADCIGKIQDREKEKLELVAQLQLLRQHMQDFPDELNHEEEAKEKKVRLKKVENEICSHMDDLKYEAEDLYH